ncbi:MAG: aminotransferase class III-fold pyridoxal phosphate-dependent enzyme, partial [Ruminococcus sp.]|nr:aminotransferase class III-fold pyridoxal phosphate-dependent enzyme [Ruminococcus sp.]
ELLSVSGIGLMRGIELKNKKASDVAAEALKKGLLVLTAKSKIRLLPPLNIEMSEIDSGLDILIDILEG